MSLNNLVKRLQDIMRNDAGINGDAQRIEQMVWILFLKVYDAKEEIWEFYDENYTSIIPEELRWRNWAVDHKDGKALTGDALLDFVNGKLFPTLKAIEIDENTPMSQIIVRTAFEDNNNYMKDGTPYEKIGDEVHPLDTPFDIPESWEWVRHNDLFEISGGSQPPKSKFISEARDGYIRLYQIRDYGNNPVPVYIPISAASKISQKGDILLARYGASLGKVFWAEDGAYNVAMARVIPLYETELISKEFLFLFYQSSLYQSVKIRNQAYALLWRMPGDFMPAQQAVILLRFD